MSNRHLARTLAMQSLFEWDFAGKQEDLITLLDRHAAQFSASSDDKDFARTLVVGTSENLSQLDSHIAQTAPDWPPEQLAAVDRAVLRLAVYELLVSKEVPPKVVIDEAVELAKTFGGDNSSKFVNGVLGTLYKHLPSAATTNTQDSVPEV